MYDRIVIGAGIIGSFTAYNLSKQGYKTLLLEQFPLDHEYGSSHGGSRIIRRAYSEQFYTDMMQEAFEGWTDLERKTNQTLFVKAGILTIDGKPYKHAKKSCENLKRVGSPFKIYSHEEFSKDFPEMDIPEDVMTIFEPIAGYIIADRAKAAVIDLCKQNNAEVITDCPVYSIEPDEIITVKTKNGDFQARSVIVCAGAWTRKLLQPTGLDIPTQPMKVFVYYWKEKKPGLCKNCPCTKYIKSNSVYSIPPREFPGYMKIAFHTGVHCTLETINEIKHDPNFSTLKDHVHLHFPSVDPESSFKQECLYTQTPDEICILDHHPRFPNLIIGTGFSGTGFKKAPTVGRILADLSNNKDTKLDMKPFSLNRFRKSNL